MLTMAIMLTGCVTRAGQEETAQPAIVTVPKPVLQPKLDIYVPLLEQFKQSQHGKAVDTLREAKAKGTRDVVDTCLQCHSYDYINAPQDQKPTLTTVKYDLTCGICHKVDVNGEYQLTSANTMKLCAQCHSKAKIVAGEIIDHPQANMYDGKGAIGVPEMPDKRKLERITCVDCHMANNSHTFQAYTITKAKEKHMQSSCILCHAKDSLDKFSKLVDETQNKVEKALDRDKARLQKLSAQKASDIYKRAYSNLTFVEMDKSKGIHNIPYTEAILDKIDADLKLLESK